MPDQNNQQSPFEIVTPSRSKKAGNKGIIVAILVVIFLILSVVAGVLLVRQRQNIQEKAAAATCPAAEACPAAGQPNLLRNCHPPESDGSPGESLCNVVGRVEFCGTQNYCCPGAGQAWTTDMAACASPTPTATPTATPTPTSAATPTASSTSTAQATTTPTSSGTSAPTATGTPTPVAQGTPQAIPVTGTDWPTLVGAGVGIMVILASILIAL